MPPDALCVKRRPGAYSRPAAGAPYTVRGVMRLKKLLFLTWSVSYGYGTEKSLADVLNRFDPKQYEISVLPMFKYAESTIFRDHIRILDALVDYTAEDFCEEKALAQVLLRYLDKYDGKKPSYDLGGAYELKAEVEQTVRLIDEAIAEREGNAKLKKLPYPETTIREDELDSLEIPADRSFILRVLRGGVPYEYLIHRKSGSEKLIVFHNGAVPEGRVRYPVFQRHSWIPMLKTSSVFCMDPTLYLNSYLQLGWGIGKNQDYYLENSSRILGRIVEKMGIRPADTAIYGSSGGGYLAAITGIFLRGAAVVADNAQLDVRNWIYKDALDAAVAFCFDNIGEALRYRERFSLIDAFEKNGYVPPLTLHVNLCSRADNSTQLIPFLQAAERMRCVQEYHDVQVRLHYHPDRGHDGLTMEEALASLYRVLGVDAPCA